MSKKKRLSQMTLDEIWPRVKRPKYETSTPSEWKTFKDIVLRFSDRIVEYLKIPGALFPWLIVPMFRYLTHDQLEDLMALRTERERANQLLLNLGGEHCNRVSFRKFVASLCVEDEHEGHQDIVNLLKDSGSLPQADLRQIQCMAKEGRSLRRACCSTNIKEVVLSLSPEICKYVNVKALIPYFLIPEYSLSIPPCRLQYLSGLPNEKAAEELLLTLDKKKQPIFCRFVACLCSELEHSGHKDILECVTETRQAIKMETRRLLVHIELKGDIVSKEFAKIDKEIWKTFESNEYDEVIKQTQKIRLHSTATSDRKIVAMCFEAVALVHQGKDAGNFQIAITQLLFPALELCEKSENEIMLRGRVCQRLAQIYSQNKQPDQAKKYFDLAKGCLFFAGRGFDKCKMLCREAKLLAVSAHGKKKEIEGLFDAALDNISGDEPYAKTCTESVLLSKAALYLNLPFGTTPKNIICKEVTADDVIKAKKILSSFEEKGPGLNNMRECEFKLLTAELRRLEGDLQGAVTGFHELINHPEKLNKNIAEIAKQRYHILKSTKPARVIGLAATAH